MYGQVMARLQVACVTSLTGDNTLETKAAEDSLAVRRAASADVDAVCARSVIYHPRCEQCIHTCTY